MNRLLKPNIYISPLKLHNVSTVHLSHGADDIFSRRVTVNISPIKLHPSSGVYISNSSNLFLRQSCILRNVPISHVKISPAQMQSGHNMYFNIYKCNYKRCSTCRFLNCNSTVKSTVNGRIFNISLPCDVD